MLRHKHDLKDYTNMSWGKDWTIFFDHQVEERAMRVVFEERELDFLVWTIDRQDGSTIAWAQSANAMCRFFMEGHFPEAAWVGSTTGHEEFQEWFGVRRGDRFKYMGGYKQRFSTQEVPGKAVVDEICEASAALAMEEEELREDPTEIGHLVRTYAKHF